jgi:hypothetical protein
MRLDEAEHELHGDRSFDRGAALAQDAIAGLDCERIGGGDDEPTAFDGALRRPSRRVLGRLRLRRRCGGDRARRRQHHPPPAARMHCHPPAPRGESAT